MTYRHYGQRLYELRCDMLLSQVDFCARVGMHQAQLSRFETGAQPVGAKLIIRVAQRLGLDIVEELRIGGFIDEQKTNSVGH